MCCQCLVTLCVCTLSMCESVTCLHSRFSPSFSVFPFFSWPQLSWTWFDINKLWHGPAAWRNPAMFWSDVILCFLGGRCVTLLMLGLCMWEMCQSPAESCDWLTGHTPPPSSPSCCLKTWSAQTLGQGLHSNCHFRSLIVASCKYPLFSIRPPLLLCLVFWSLCFCPPFSSFFLFVCLSILFPTWPPSLYFDLFLFRADTHLVVV